MQSIKNYLRRNKIRQKDLAAKVDVTEAQLSRILSGKRGASRSLLLRLSDHTRIPLGKLAKENRPDGRAQP
jgi:transcriptional regulator with XRE-family HTH domain